jgi:hypothetical protein
MVRAAAVDNQVFGMHVPFAREASCFLRCQFSVEQVASLKAPHAMQNLNLEGCREEPLQNR